MDNLRFSVDNYVDNFLPQKLSTFCPQGYPQVMYLFLNEKSDLSTEKRAPNNNKFKFKFINFIITQPQTCG